MRCEVRPSARFSLDVGRWGLQAQCCETTHHVLWQFAPFAFCCVGGGSEVFTARAEGVGGVSWASTAGADVTTQFCQLGKAGSGSSERSPVTSLGKESRHWLRAGPGSYTELHANPTLPRDPGQITSLLWPQFTHQLNGDKHGN